MIDRIEKTARKAILQSGELIRRHIGSISNSYVHTKGPSDYVTEIDKESESSIIQTIREDFPDHSILAEETSNIRLGEETTWIIDPLDGTTNFIHGFPFVAVSIAVSMRKQVVLGMVLDPVRDELFTAQRGKGAYLNDKPLRLKQLGGLDQTLIATGFPFRAKHLLEPYLNTFRNVFSKVSGIRRAGSAALDLAYVAAGRVDGFWEAGLKPWDVAAGSLLVLEAGGRVDDFWGTGGYLQNGHIVAGVDLVHTFLMDQVEQFLAPALKSKDENR